MADLQHSTTTDMIAFARFIVCNNIESIYKA